jgi:NAD(P)-dependent dehydrogenase (short-subunit alcohol dehydrogenase family)
VYGGRQLTTDGIELTWAVNHLAPFLLTTLLLDRLKQSAPARITLGRRPACIGGTDKSPAVNGALRAPRAGH